MTLDRKTIECFRDAITGGGLLGGTMPTGTDVVTMCTMLLDQERDAKLGAAVRQAVEYAASDDATSPLVFALRTEGKYSDEAADPDGDVWAVFYAIAKALREEAP